MSLQSLANELYFKRLARQQAHGVILHYDAQAQALRPWYWYVDTGYSIAGFDGNTVIQGLLNRVESAYPHLSLTITAPHMHSRIHRVSVHSLDQYKSRHPFTSLWRGPIGASM
jgi:hypothetical protein